MQKQLTANASGTVTMTFGRAMHDQYYAVLIPNTVGYSVSDATKNSCKITCAEWANRTIWLTAVIVGMF